MTWDDALQWIMEWSTDLGAAECLVPDTRDALAQGMPVFDHVRETAVDADAIGPSAAVCACLAVGLDLQALSISRGPDGGRALLLGDGLVTRSLELAAGLGSETLEATMDLANELMGARCPHDTMCRLLDRERLNLFVSPTYDLERDGGTP